MLLSKVLAQEKMKNAPTACFDRSLYNFRFFIRAHEIPCQQSVSSAREKSDLTIRGSENPFSDKRGQKKLTVNTRIKTEIYATARFWS